MAVRGIGEGYPAVPQLKPEDKGQKSFPSARPEGKELTVDLKESFDFKKIYGIKSDLFNSVRFIKEEDIRDFIDHISEKVLDMNKVFPPYPPGSEERIEALRSFIAFRALIERLTIPQEQREEIMKLSAQAAEVKSLDIKNSLSGEKTGIARETAFLKEF